MSITLDGTDGVTTTGLTSNGIDDNATSTAITIDSSENVGIGTTNPGSKLVVEAGDDDGIRIDSSDNTFTGRLSFGDVSDNYIGAIEYDHNVDAMWFYVNNAERMRIDSSGDVNISGNLQAGDGTDISMSSSSAGQLTLDGDGYSGAIALDATGLHLYQNSSARSVIFGTNETERMRIDGSGNLLVGTTSTYSTSPKVAIGIQSTGTGLEMHNSGGTAWTAVRFHTAATLAGYISVGTTTTTYNTSSDVRLKENIVDAPAGNIDDIRVRSFDWKADGTHQTYGMVAQELVDVAPEAVSQGETEDDMWGVDYSKLVPMMIKEIQDLKAEVAALKGA